MIVLPPIARYALRAHHINRRAAAEREPSGPDPAPVIKFFIFLLGPQTLLAIELAEDGDVLWGLADLGFVCPEIGPWSLSELSAFHLPLAWASKSILWTETLFRRSPLGDPLPD